MDRMITMTIGALDLSEQDGDIERGLSNRDPWLIENLIERYHQIFNLSDVEEYVSLVRKKAELKVQEDYDNELTKIMDEAKAPFSRISFCITFKSMKQTDEASIAVMENRYL